MRLIIHTVGVSRVTFLKYFFTDLITSVVLVLKQYFLLLIPDKDMQDCIKFISSPAVSFYAVS